MTWEPGQSVKLETERFVLRSLTEHDVSERYVGWLRDPEVTRYMDARFKEQTIATVRDYVRRNDNRTRFLLGIFTKAENEHLGNIEASVDPHHKTARTGVMIGERAYWGKGVVLEVREAMIDFLFAELDVVKMWGYCYGDHAAALFNYKAQGFHLEALLKSEAVSGDHRVDVARFALFRDEWAAKKRGDAG